MRQWFEGVVVALPLVGACDRDSVSHCDCVGGESSDIEALCGSPTRIDANESAAAVMAALTALRDGTPVEIDFVLHLPDGVFTGRAGYAYAPGDGTVFFASRDIDMNFSMIELPIDHYQLRSTQYFDDCLAEPEPDARFNCLFAITGEKLGRCGE